MKSLRGIYHKTVKFERLSHIKKRTMEQQNKKTQYSLYCTIIITSIVSLGFCMLFMLNNHPKAIESICSNLSELGLKPKNKTGGKCELNFQAGSHTVKLCGMKTRACHMWIDNTVFYSHADLKVLETFLKPCFTEDSSCNVSAFQTTKAGIYSKECQYYTSMENLISLCFSATGRLTRGFVNTTIFKPKELEFLYYAIRYFALEDEAYQHKTINSPTYSSVTTKNNGQN